MERDGSMWPTMSELVLSLNGCGLNSVLDAVPMLVDGEILRLQATGEPVRAQVLADHREEMIMRWRTLLAETSVPMDSE